jgi:hypothetical protein
MIFISREQGCKSQIFQRPNLITTTSQINSLTGTLLHIALFWVFYLQPLSQLAAAARFKALH